MKLIPTRMQWKKWSLPSKLTAIGTALAVLSLLLAIFLSVAPLLYPRSLGERLQSVLESAFLSARDSNQEDFIFFHNNELRPKHFTREDVREFRSRIEFEFFSNSGIPIDNDDFIGRYYFVMVYQPTRPCNRHVGITKRVAETLRPYIHTEFSHLLVNISAYDGAVEASAVFEERYGLSGSNVWISNSQIEDAERQQITSNFLHDIPFEVEYPGINMIEESIGPEHVADWTKKRELYEDKIQQNEVVIDKRRKFKDELQGKLGSSILRSMRAYWNIGFSPEEGDFSQTAGIVNADGELVALMFFSHSNEEVDNLDDFTVALLQNIAREHPELLRFDRLTIDQIANAPPIRKAHDLAHISVVEEISLNLENERTQLARLENEERLDMCDHG